MRSAILLPILVAACADEGATLTVRAADGPVFAERLEIVLASVATANLDQRVTPNGLGGETVRYFRQRSVGGSINNVRPVDGFVVRIEPNPGEVPETSFVPLLIAYDAVDRVIGIGAVDAGPAFDARPGEPAAIEIASGTRVQYFVDMVALAPSDGAAGIAEHESVTIDCTSEGTTWPSGVAWRVDGKQLRLLRPDLGVDGNATDATERTTDLDCDGHAAPLKDCDDLRGAFHVDHVEQCDGIDANCDGITCASVNGG